MIVICSNIRYNSDMEDYRVKAIDAIKINKVLNSTKLTDAQKAEFIKQNVVEIKQILKSKITKEEFVHLMHNRPLIRFRPFKNSFTKCGDKILLAKSIGINANDVEHYVSRLVDSDMQISNSASKNEIELVKTYIYRHGTKEQVIKCLDYELSNVNSTLKTLYKTLKDNSGGLSDYFARPIHRMDNKTLTKLYSIIDKRLVAAYEAGVIDKKEFNVSAKWALIRIYQIQNNSKIIRAFNKYKDLQMEV